MGMKLYCPSIHQPDRLSVNIHNVFNYTRGGLIQLSHGKPHNLQYVANAAFLASLFAYYLNATDVHGWQCCPDFYPLTVLKMFATSQINYILGANPLNMSYVVGYGSKYPKHVHHRGASIPINKTKYSCTGGARWRDAGTRDPNTINGAMVGGPDRLDQFKDIRTNYSYTEPTLAGMASYYDGYEIVLSEYPSTRSIICQHSQQMAALEHMMIRS